MRWWCGVIFVSLCLWASVAWGQQAQSQPSAPTALGGVTITPEGLLRARVTAPPAKRPGDPSLTYVSLARLIDTLKLLEQSHTTIPKDLRYLQGLTRIDYLFVFPEQHDIVFAGSSEPYRDSNPLQPTGTLSNRPVVQLDDLVVALRAVREANARTIFGCSLDLAPNAQQIAADVGRRFGNLPRAQLAQRLKEALGPQVVRVLGVPADSRMALAMVTADYRLKRIAIGAEPLPNVGNALSSGLASNRVWFQPAYDAITVAPDGLSYQFTGPRLQVLAGAQEFDTQGATPAAEAFARRFSQRMHDAAGRIDALADLQNVTDLLLLACLIRQDQLAAKTGVDLAWLIDPANYRPAATPVPRTADTVVFDNGTVISEGGVLVTAESLTSAPRTADSKSALASLRARPTDWFLTRPAASKSNP
jgi:hypothetical protein